MRSRTWIEELTGPEFTSELAVRRCPNCQKALFDNIEVCDNVNISIIGDTSSGKTNYIAVLIDQLKSGKLMQHGQGTVRLMHLNRHTSETYRQVYQKPILADRQAVAATLRGTYDREGRAVRAEPLVYQLSIKDHGTGVDSTINLLFYDIAGEHFTTRDEVVSFGAHVLRPDGIIYFADPMRMPYIHQQLPPHLQDPSGSAGHRKVEEALDTVIFTMEGYNRLRPGETIDIPTAIAISKSDLLQYIIPQHEWRNYRLMHRPYYDGRVHLQEVQRIDGEVRTLLQRHSETGLLQASQRFEQVSFFALAATGNAPDYRGQYASIDPQRCLDPLMWLLWKLRFLEAVPV
jgi:Double-GTPase 2